MEVYAWGSGNYGRLGLGHSRDVRIPQRVSGVLNGCDVTSTACGWYHSAVVTSTGEVATFGSRVTKCLGTADSGSEASEADRSDGAGSGASASEEEGGDADEDEDAAGPGAAHRAAAASSAAGGRRKAGRRRSGASGRGDRQHCTADFVPHVLRSFPSRVVVVQVAVGSDMLGAHTLALSRTGRLYSWGYGPACGLGTTRNVGTPTLVTKFLGTVPGQSAGDRLRAGEMEPYGWGRHSHQRYRKKIPNRHLGLQVLQPRLAKVACGGGFSVVLSSDGEVFTFGLSASGRLGFRTKFRAQLRPRRVETLGEGTMDLSAGAGFVLLCSAAGRVVAWGDNTKGQLGIGHLQESYEPMGLGRVCPAAFVMQAVAAGDSHSLALDSSGRLYSWGGEGGPMTGQGYALPNSLQVDAAFQFRLRALPHWWVRPSPVRALLGTRVVRIAAGCLHSLALSEEGALFAWGAALQSGASTAAGPAAADRLEVSWVPRLLAPSPKLPLVRVGAISAGGWHSITTASPSCPIERLAPPMDGEAVDDVHQSFCDAYMVSEPDSDAHEEARVMLCCAAVRARLAAPDGTDSPMWAALSAQLVRLLPELPASGEEEEEEEGGGGDGDPGSDSGDLMEIVAMHKERPAPRPRLGRAARAARAVGAAGRPLPSPRQTSDADEAAGKARPASAGPPAGKEKARGRPPGFLEDEGAGAGGSDASSSSSEPRRPPPPLRARQRAAWPRPAVVFSSDSSGSDHEPRPSTVSSAPAAASSSAAAAARAVAPSSSSSRPAQGIGAGLGLRLCMFSEAVLAALARFLHTDSLGRLELIDESHPAWQREMHLKLRPLGPPPGEPQEDYAAERPSMQRAAKGLLLRREVLDLRRIGHALRLERLVCLCDQLVHRVDAPGAPALFVPASHFGTAMWTLLQQTLVQASRDGCDTRVLCGAPLPRTPHWGLARTPVGGVHLAHAFVLCVGCGNIRPEPGAPVEQHRGRAAHAPDVDWQAMCCLRRCDGPGSGGARFELDLRDVAADVVSAWLRYLYTQDDLTQIWPLEGDRVLDVVAAERFWIELLRLAQRLADHKLLLYAQDVLVGALSAENWAHLAMFAEQAQCRLLSESALMMGLRLLQPAMLASFKVPTGFERDAQQPDDEDAKARGIPEHVAMVAGASSSSGGGARGTVDLELDRHLMELRSGVGGVEPAHIRALKRGSPAQFAELKHRLADSITAAQRAAAQLQHCQRFFDSHDELGLGLNQSGGRARWLEVVVLALLLCFFMVPSAARQTVVNFMVSSAEPLRAWASYVDWSWMPFMASGAVRLVTINLIMFLILAAVMWSGLKG